MTLLSQLGRVAFGGLCWCLNLSQMGGETFSVLAWRIASGAYSGTDTYSASCSRGMHSTLH